MAALLRPAKRAEETVAFLSPTQRREGAIVKSDLLRTVPEGTANVSSIHIFMSRRLKLLSLSIPLSSLLFSMTDHGAGPQASDSLAVSNSRCDLLLPTDTILTLTEEDFEEVAAELGVEVAAIKAVVEIEAGRTHEGFVAPGKPLVNFDLSMFRRFATRRGVNLSKYGKSHSVVFTSSRGSQTRAHQRLEAAKSINFNAAVEGTFWGMFQIGGFNWKKCGAKNIEDFVCRMSRSERDQLEMFANFIVSTDLLKYLKSKNWAAFARGYNGPGYAKRGYHTRMAQAYARYNKKS